MYLYYDIKCKEYEQALRTISENIEHKNLLITNHEISDDTLRSELRSVVELMTAISIIQQKLNNERLTLKKICENKKIRKVSGCLFLLTLALGAIHYQNILNPRNGSPKNSLLLFFTTLTITAGVFYAIFQSKIYSEKFINYQILSSVALAQASSLQQKINKLIEDKVRTSSRT